MAYNPLNPNGQATMANSQPVVLASNQSPVSVLTYQADPTKLVGTVSIVSSAPASVSGVGVFNVNNIGNGSVITVSQGSIATVIIGGSVAVATGNSSVQLVGGTAMIGSVTAYQGTKPWDMAGSVVAFLGNSTNASVVTAQGTNPWIVQLTSGSVITTGGNSSVQVVGTMPPQSVSGVGLFNVNPTGNGSVITLFSQTPSIVGTYAEDAPHSSGDKGILTLNVRNDTMSSVTSNDGDYGAIALGPIGEVITAPAPITKWWSTQTSVMYGTSVQAFAPQGSSVFTYIQGLQVMNDSATGSRIKITGGLGSVLAWTVAPASGGSNIIFTPAIKTGENSGVSASINGVSSIYLSMQGFTSKT